MNCPVCNGVMTEKNFGGVTVNICEDGCKGIWFDWMELSKLDEENEGFGGALMAAMNHPRVNDENREPLGCPKCGLVMYTHKYKSSTEVNVDECCQCGGFFLDSGELRVIKESFMTEHERDQYIQELLTEIPGYKELEKKLERQKAKAAYNMTKHFRLSYYMNRKKKQLDK
ncbi:MAG: zf-TFIIB domain-containing protein [Sedimentisphaerales bacterium]|nr:zf-TFIIB domain-containing protein [Sedimentisphaerales bacterium]